MFIYVGCSKKRKIRSLEQYTYDERGKIMKNVEEIAYSAFEDQCTPANPRYPLISEIEEIYTKAYYGDNE